MTEWWEWGDEDGDRLLTVAAWAVVFGAWLKEGEPYQRVADLKVPTGILPATLLLAVVGRRMSSRQWAAAGNSMNELAETLAKRMVENDERQQQLVDLQASLERLAHDSSGREQQLVDLQASLESLAKESSGREETLVALQKAVTRYTRWLLVLTVGVVVIGAGSIATAIVIAATQ